MSKLLVFAGSLRHDSYNRILARLVARLAEKRGMEITLVDLAKFPLPLYDGDLEVAQGVPNNALKLKELFIAHEGFLIAAPEYNGSIPPLLKNTLDWVSRPLPEQSGYKPFAGKAAGLLSASPGALGGMRGLRHLRDVLTVLKVIVVPEQASISAADQAFDDAGELKDPRATQRVVDLVVEVERMARLLHG